MDGHNKVAGGEGLQCYGADFDDEIRSERGKGGFFQADCQESLVVQTFFLGD